MGIETLAHSCGISPFPCLTKTASASPHIFLIVLFAFSIFFSFPGIPYFSLSADPFRPTWHSHFLEVSIALRIHTSQLSL